MQRLNSMEFKVTLNIEKARKRYTNDLILRPTGYNAARLYLLDVIESEWIYETTNDIDRLTVLLRYEDRIDEVIDSIYDSEKTTLGIVNQLRQIADNTK